MGKLYQRLFQSQQIRYDKVVPKKDKLQFATFAGGCFWCTEAIFRRLKGVETVIPGYSGGKVENPTYDQVAAAITGHAEAIQINFDPSQISYRKLLEVFFKTHDPTTLNRQGADVGSQYRSVIFYRSKEQESEAKSFIKSLEDSKDFNQKIVTEVVKFSSFYPADKSHKNYYEKNRGAFYCRIVIDPKIQKLYKEFSEEVKQS